MTREEMVAAAAYHIDKCCTGGTDEDWEAAERIVGELVDPLVAENDRLRCPVPTDEMVERAARVHADWEGLDHQDSIREQVREMLTAALTRKKDLS